MVDNEMPRVYNKRDKNIPKGAVYVGRPSKWGNPYTVEECGREMAIQCYREWLETKIMFGELDPSELKGQDLVCWCHPKACHAHVLLEYANGR